MHVGVERLQVLAVDFAVESILEVGASIQAVALIGLFDFLEDLKQALRGLIVDDVV